MARSNCDFCCNPTELARQIDSYRAAVLNILCAINDNTSEAAEGIQVVTSCLEVTTAGAWGSIGDRITETRFYQTNPLPPTVVGTIYFNEDTQAVVTGITAGNTQPCPGADIGESCANPMFSQLCAGSAIVGNFRIDQTTPGTTNKVWVDLEQVAGATIAQGHGTAATAIRVELPTDGTGVVGLAAGSAVVGTVSINQATSGTTNNVTIGSNTTTPGNSPVRLEDTAFADGNALMMAGSVVNTNMAVNINAQNDCAQISSGSYGNILNTLVYDNASSIQPLSPIRAEDTPFGANEAVMLGGQQRQDTPLDNTSASLDIMPLKGTQYGETWMQRGGGSFSRIVTATTTTVKSGVGILHRININTAVANAVITIYDNTAGSGTVIAIITEPAAPLQNHVTLEYGLRFGTGLTIVTSSTEDITVVYS